MTGNASGLATVEIAVGAGGADIVTVLGSTSAADAFVISTEAGKTKVVRSTVPADTANSYTALISGGVRSQGDALVVDGRGGDDTISAATMSADQLALTLRGGDDDDTLVGSSFDDILDSGTGNDTVTGGLGRDTFTDAGGIDTLVESFAAGDFGLYNNLFVVGLVVGTDFGVGSVAEDLLGIFEIARLTSTAPGATTILVGDADGAVLVARLLARAANPWTRNRVPRRRTRRRPRAHRAHAFHRDRRPREGPLGRRPARSLGLDRAR